MANGVAYLVCFCQTPSIDESIVRRCRRVSTKRIEKLKGENMFSFLCVWQFQVELEPAENYLWHSEMRNERTEREKRDGFEIDFIYILLQKKNRKLCCFQNREWFRILWVREHVELEQKYSERCFASYLTKKINSELSKNIIFIGCLSPHIHFSLPVHLLLCFSARCNLSRGRTMNSNVAQMFEFYTKKCVCSTVYECEKCKWYIS